MAAVASKVMKAPFRRRLDRVRVIFVGRFKTKVDE